MNFTRRIVSPLFVVLFAVSVVYSQSPDTLSGNPGDRLTVTLNDKLVIDDAELPGIPRQGPIALQLHSERRDGEWGASLVQFRSIRIKELISED